MKKILTIIAILISFNSIAQDSVKITITPQARDIELMASMIYGNPLCEELFDTLKVKFRVQNPPTNTTTVSVTGYTVDWYSAFLFLKYNEIALKSGTANRVEALLRALNQVHLTALLDALDAADVTSFNNLRIIGRNKLRRL